MRHLRLRGLWALTAGFLVSVWCTAGISLAGAGDFPAKIIYVPRFHSRPYLVRQVRPEAASPIKKISINEPGIAEVKVIDPFELVIDGRYPGSTMCLVWYEDGSMDYLEIRVTLPKPNYVYDVEVIKGLDSDLWHSRGRIIW